MLKAEGEWYRRKSSIQGARRAGNSNYSAIGRGILRQESLMVRALERWQSIKNSSKSRHLKRIFENAKQRVVDGMDHERSHSSDETQSSKSVGERSPLDTKRPGWDPNLMSCLDGAQTPSPVPNGPPSDIELLKEKFAKLLLGEDMSGGGKGVPSALALSNAITNLAASVFGEQRKLEPMSPDRKLRWRKEIDWLLSVTDHIVELVPSKQTAKDGSIMEIMVTRQRKDLHINIPALRKLDAMLLGILDNFGGQQNEFWYASKDDKESGGRKDDKWWLPTVKVPPNGLSEGARKWLLYQKDSVHQLLKAAMAINAQVLSEMAIPEDYIEHLPKNGRESLGDLIYKSITEEYFDPDQLLSAMDLSTEHKVLDLKNRIEASIIIWMRKMTSKDVKSSWSSGISLEKRELFEERAETILILLKQRFPGIPQSSLEVSKIQDNKDVGQAVLESYSRVIESLAYTVLSRIEDVLDADSLTHNLTPQSSAESTPIYKRNDADSDEEDEETPTSMTLSDFMGWDLERRNTKVWKNPQIDNPQTDDDDEDDDKAAGKSYIGSKVTSYMDYLTPLKSPTPRQ